MTTSRVPFNADKAREWNTKWEQRYAKNYVPRDDGQHFARPGLKPTPTNTPPKGAREPHSAAVIRALELHINGRVLSPPAAGAGEP